MFKNIFKELFLYSKVNTSIYLVIDLISKIISFYFIVLLSNILTNLNYLDINKLVIIVLLPILIYIINIYSLYLEKLFSEYYCNKYSKMLLKCYKNKDISSLEKLASRDINILLDNIQNAFSLISTILFFCFISIFFIFKFQNIVIYYLTTCIILGYIAYKISVLGDNNFSKIINIVGSRIEICSNWLRNGYFLKQFIGNFSKVNNQLDKINNIFTEEKKLRNIDTLYQSASRFIIVFGRLIIYILLIISGFLLDESNTILLLWISLPIINIIFNLPTYYISYKNIKRVIKNLNDYYKQANYKDKISTKVKTDYIYDNELIIYPAKLIELIPFYNLIDKNELEMIINEFRLIPEISDNIEDILNKKINLYGNNLSNGQKFRLQIIRQYFLTKFLKINFIFNHNFNSLDIEIANKIKEFLIKNNVIISRNSINSLESREQLSNEKNIDTNNQNKDININNASIPTYKTSNKIIFSFIYSTIIILPTAILLSYSTNISINEGSIYLLSAYLFFGISLGVISSILIENTIRNKFSSKFLNKIKNVFSSDIDKIQIISRDITTIFERISWYTFDIAWMISLFIINFVSLIFIFNALGTILFLAFISILFTLYIVSIDKVTKTRIMTIDGFNSLIEAVQIVYSIELIKQNQLIKHDFFDLYKEKKVNQKVYNFFSTRIKAIITKSIVSSTALLVSDIFIILILSLNNVLSNYNSLIITALTSLLIIRNDIVNIFFAIIGYKSQSISITNIDYFCSQSCNIQINKEYNQINFPSLLSLDNKQYYKSLNIEANKLYKLSGESGSGKSCYLKAISGISKSESDISNNIGNKINNISVYYLNSEVLSELGVELYKKSIVDFIIKLATEHLINNRDLLITIDELEIFDNKNNIEYLNKLINKFKNLTLIIVNHNINYDQLIDINKLKIN